MKKTTFVKKTRKTATFSTNDSSNNTTSPNKGELLPSDVEGNQATHSRSSLLFSTGLADFDELFGGGLPSGTLLAIKEDVNTTHYATLLRYFVAEGIASGDAVVYVGGSSPLSLFPVSTDFILSSLPDLQSKGTYEKEDESQTTGGIHSFEKEEEGRKKGLKIAWRYEEARQLNESFRAQKRNSTAHSFDFTKRMKKEKVEEEVRRIHLDEWSDDDGDENLQLIICRIRSVINALRLGNELRPIRIVLQSFGMPLWRGSSVAHQTFLSAIRSLIRQSPSTIGFMSVIPGTANRINSIPDTIVSLRSFAGLGEEVNEAFKDYSGFLYIDKLLRFGGLSFHHRPETLVYGFYRSRKRLVIEKLHLQPESKRFSSSSQKSENVDSSNKTISELLCQPSHHSSGESVLDF